MLPTLWLMILLLRASLNPLFVFLRRKRTTIDNFLLLDSWVQQEPARAMYIDNSPLIYISILCLFSKIIDTLTNQPGMRSGSSLASCTQQIQAVRVYEHPKYANRLVLVDTPGFDDTHKSDMEILQMISDWLKKTYFFIVFFLYSFLFLTGRVYLLLGTRKVSNLQELCIYTKSPTIACLAHLIATYACFPSYAVIRV